MQLIGLSLSTMR